MDKAFLWEKKLVKTEMDIVIHSSIFLSMLQKNKTILFLQTEPEVYKDFAQYYFQKYSAKELGGNP